MTSHSSPPLTEVQFAVLRDAVTLARNGLGNRLSVLRARLASLGHAEDDIKAALFFWADYENSKTRKTEK